MPTVRDQRLVTVMLAARPATAQKGKPRTAWRWGRSMVAILAEGLYGTTMAHGPGQQPEAARGGDRRRADHRPAHHRPLDEPRRRTWTIGTPSGQPPREQPGALPDRRQGRVPAGLAGAGHVQPDQLSGGPSGQAASDRGCGGLLPDR